MITCQIATIPERIDCLPTVISSLHKQVDRLNIICNGHTPEQLKRFEGMQFDCEVIFWRRNNEMTDGEKYWNIENAEPGYILTCDDDLEYPPDYVNYMISKVEQYERGFVVTLHGRVFLELPIYSFYRDRRNYEKNTPGAGMFQCLNTVKHDEVILNDSTIGCGGDGVMCWHTDTLKMRYDYVEKPNMSQLWMALTCNRLRVPQVVVAHEADGLNVIWDGPGIWDAENQNDGVQTNLINTRWITR